jgi:sulfide:quinone oxidoreductase
LIDLHVADAFADATYAQRLTRPRPCPRRSRSQNGTAFKVPLCPTLSKFGIAFDDADAKHVRPEQNCIELGDGRVLPYDYLVDRHGSGAGVRRSRGSRTGRNSVSICHVEHAAKAAERWRAFCADPGPIVVGAVQGASCFGPAYEFAFLANADLRKRRIRDRVPITLVTSEPYIGHLGLGGVGDTKGLLESGLRDRDIRWITNAKIERVLPDASKSSN